MKRRMKCSDWSVNTSPERMGQISWSKPQSMSSHKKEQCSHRKTRDGALHKPSVQFSRVREVSDVWATGPGLFLRVAEASIRQEDGSKLRKRRFPGRSLAPEGTRLVLEPVWQDINSAL